MWTRCSGCRTQRPSTGRWPLCASSTSCPRARPCTTPRSTFRSNRGPPRQPPEAHKRSRPPSPSVRACSRHGPIPRICAPPGARTLSTGCQQARAQASNCRTGRQLSCRQGAAGARWRTCRPTARSPHLRNTSRHRTSCPSQLSRPRNGGEVFRQRTARGRQGPPCSANSSPRGNRASRGRANAATRRAGARRTRPSRSCSP
mmetsp:Transcript_64050/g.178022  ORF Transcript_64050/g.178022 Transcript_64050/m.178022 type:complete len:202 (-) Transcript_64050:162-767(-)